MKYLPIVAAVTGDTSAIQTAFETAIATVKTDALGMITAAVPVALAIGASVLAVRLGWKFFKSMAR